MHSFFQFVIAHWPLWLTLVILVIGIAFVETDTYFAKVKALSPQEAVLLLNRNEAFIFDVRTQEAYQKGHITGAKHMLPEWVMRDRTEIQKQCETRPCIFVCNDGVSSAKLTLQLKKTGISNLFMIKGGINAWIEANLPLFQK